MSVFLLNVLLAIAWSALTGDFSPLNLGFGFVLAYGVLWLLTRKSSSRSYFLQIPRVIEFVFFFAWDVFKANVRMAITILSPQMRLRPAVVMVPLDMKNEIGIILLSNLITLTPGTLSLDISSDRKALFIHTLWVEDEEKFRAEIKSGYERRVKEIIEA
ncbi:MAG: Na+/H+ antiporter subunit E [Anaerolineaceae bacterium]|nr:Na+/H+ antiporter subunit E [Anaerolineaceae bacterium]